MVYLLLWIIIPRDDRARDSSFENTVQSSSQEVRERVRAMSEDFRYLIQHPNLRLGLIIGFALIIFGVVFLVQILNSPWLIWINFNVVRALLIILAGIAFLTRHLRGD